MAAWIVPDEPTKGIEVGDSDVEEVAIRFEKKA